MNKILKELQYTLNSPSVTKAIEKLMSENSELKGKVSEFSTYRNSNMAQKIKKELERGENGYLWYVGNMDIPVEDTKDIAIRLYNELPDIVFINGGIVADKPSLVVMVGNKLTKMGINAGNIVREAAKLMQGGGGGQPHLATAGGKDNTKLGESIAKAVEMIKEAIAKS